MIKCTECGTANYEGSLFCTECGAFIEDFDPNSTAVLPFSEFAHRPPPPPLTDSELEIDATPRTITIVVPGSRRRTILALTGEIQIGRSDPKSGHFPELDLTVDEGADKGVSRLHAAIRASKKGLVLVDLGSTNGTLLNMYRLPPEQPYPLKSGDEIRIGDLLIHLFFD